MRVAKDTISSRLQAEAAKSPLCLSRGSGEGSRPLNSTNTCSIFYPLHLIIISSGNKPLGFMISRTYSIKAENRFFTFRGAFPPPRASIVFLNLCPVSLTA